jgi:hypothetical protein
MGAWQLSNIHSNTPRLIEGQHLGPLLQRLAEIASEPTLLEVALLEEEVAELKALLASSAARPAELL